MKILTAMSGGVDSTVTAALLQQQGHQVVGVMMRLFDERRYGVEAPSRTCCAITDIEDARLAAHRLGLPFHVFNYSRRFKQEVIDRFAAAYAAGQTPNPCLDCNRYLKFDALLQQAEAMGFDAIATGHYARVEQTEDGTWLLKKAVDAAKDQSYVLYTLTQPQLARLRLPLGGMHKPQVREIADTLGLGNAHKPDSQDICFVPDGDYAAFLRRECGIESAPGSFVTTGGDVLGAHKGLVHYTVGQRRGLGVSSGTRLFVTALRPEANQVVLGTEAELATTRFAVADTSWTATAPTGPLQVEVRTRYHQPERPATLYPGAENTWVVEYAAPQRAPAPGQAAVFYSGDIVLGGGRILPGCP